MLFFSSFVILYTPRDERKKNNFKTKHRKQAKVRESYNHKRENRKKTERGDDDKKRKSK